MLKYGIGRSECSRFELLLRYLCEPFANLAVEYLDEGLAVIDGLTESIRKEVGEANIMPGRPLRRMELIAVYALVRAFKLQRIVETGVAHGASSACILSALERNGSGHLYSIDLPNAVYLSDEDLQVTDAKAQDTGWLVKGGLRKNWTLMLGRSDELLPGLLSELGQIDLFLHDSEHTYATMMLEYTSAWPRLKGGGFLVSGDVKWNKSFDDFVNSRGAVSRSASGMGVVRKPFAEGRRTF